MKEPKPIRAFAIVNTQNPKLKVLEIYSSKDVYKKNNESICLIEIKFLKKIK